MRGNAQIISLCESILKYRTVGAPMSTVRRASMHDKPVALVTGANKGIGLQIAKDLAKRGFTVLVGSRDIGKGDAAAKSVGDDAHAIQLDVTDKVSITA